MEFIKKTILAGMALACYAGLSFAEGNIRGHVVNKDTGEPMDFVTIQIFDQSGKPLQISTITDDTGEFILENVPDGNYTVKIINVGSINQERPVEIKQGDVELGIINLADDAKLLNEVVVEGIRSQMRFELDKKVFQVDSNIVSAGSSASELLESIPSVEVDQDGEVSLRGNSSVTIWLNGKDSGLTADNRAQILEQIPAENIDRIEVITNPSAKYSPEGTAGIINIILKKNTKGGYYGSAEVSANSRGGANASASINWNTGKWETFASIGYRYHRNTGGSVMERDFTNGNFTHSRGNSKNHGQNLFLRLGATYHLTDQDEIYLNGFGMFGNRKRTSTTDYTANMPGQWLAAFQNSESNNSTQGAHGELGYVHEWNENHNLRANVSYNYWGGPQHNIYTEEETWANDSIADTYRDQELPLNFSSWEAKVDYTNLLNQYLKLEAGYNGNYSRENSPSTTILGTSAGNAVLAPELYNRFLYRNDISALYVTLGGRTGIFSYSAGLRAETWQIYSKSMAYGQSEADVSPFKKNKFSLFPSVYLSLSLPKENELQINYTRRIRRPWGGQLNSFHDVSDPTSVSFGNPQLEPEYSNSFELNYLKTWTYHILSISAYMRQSSNIMNRISYMDDDVMYSTWANVSSQINSGVEIVGKNSLFKNFLDLTTTVNLYQSHISAWSYDVIAESGRAINLSGKVQNSFAWDARMMANFRLPWELGLQITGGYHSEQKTATGSRQGGWSVDAGIRRTFGSWSISLNCRDIFDSRKFRNTINGDGYTEYTERWRGGRQVRLTVKYSFGNMKAKRNKNMEAEMQTGGYEQMEM